MTDATAQARTKVEFGDFQTPISLAEAVAARVKISGFMPASIIEPSCGVGNMLLAAVEVFPTFQQALGIDAQPSCLAQVRTRMELRMDRNRIALHDANFFEFDWRSELAALPDPLLVIGNPPWVTNTELSAMGSRNLPAKTNFQGHSGLDALTGKSNFDIAEAMLMKIFGWLARRDAMVVMICKTAVARKVLAYAWNQAMPISTASIWEIDAASSFGAAVDACVLKCRFGLCNQPTICPVYSSLSATSPTHTIAYRTGRMLANADAFDRWHHLEGEDSYRWRSGIKHDCAPVVELFFRNGQFHTKDGATVDIERKFVFPMLKASDLANGRTETPRRWMIVTQQSVGENTRHIATAAPKTWAYLTRNAERFARRGSVIYKDRPLFSMFGIGTYSFAPWKVGIAGLYKKLAFNVIGPYQEKPIVLDDTCYFIGCQTEIEARLIASILNSTPVREFYSAFIFWDAKRPVTVDILRRLDLRKAAAELGLSLEFDLHTNADAAHAANVCSGTLWPDLK